MRTFWLILYYGIAAKLPKSTVHVLGKFGRYMRWKCAEHLFAECNGYVNVEQGAYFGNGKDFHVLGGGVGIGKNFICHGRIVTFHGNLLMGEDVLFQGTNHDVETLRVINRKDPLEIGENVWICARAIILSGCKKIGNGAIIGAGSVVTHDVPDNAIVAGNPAHIIRLKGGS